MYTHRSIIAWCRTAPSWAGAGPIREELFGADRLEQHAETLAAADSVEDRHAAVYSLHDRLAENARVLLAAYRASAADVASGQGVVPAAEWLLDNYHIVEKQVREIQTDLPRGYYRQLPKLAAGPFVGYPRVFGIAWAYVAHTDSNFEPESLERFVAAYQRVQPLTIGELWAIAITLRIVLVENLRRLADQITTAKIARDDADAMADAVLVAGHERQALEIDILSRPKDPLSEHFAAQLAKRLRDQDPRTTPALQWLEERLGHQSLSVDQAVHHAQQSLGISNVTMRNIVTSMRMMSDIDWADFFESVSLVDVLLRRSGSFDAMDFPTRNLYRSAVEHLARGSALTEQDIADRAVDVAADAARSATDDEARRVGDPGHHLVGEGRPAFERTVSYRPGPRASFRRLSSRLGIWGYLGSILVLTAAFLALAAWAMSLASLGVGWLAAFLVLAFVPASEVATVLVDRALTLGLGATALPGLALADGVPTAERTLVAVPTLMTDEADLLEQIGRLEVHHLSGAGGDLTFALLVDGLDADYETVEGDEALLRIGVAAIDELNRRHGPGPGGARFLLLHRRRVYDAGEGVWMGWERKRGKLHELNRLLRGAEDTTFEPIAGRLPKVPGGVRYVITLDADTRLPRDAATRLVGKMAHPLNRPRFDARSRRVVSGYGILQPRVTPSLPIGREGSFFQRVVSGPGGIDPYAAAVSDVYQDLFGEGSFTGKGIYDVDAFEMALAGRVPASAMLSHDLFEGIFARAGLASDVEVLEEQPSRYDVAAKRRHRWTRGDWQLLPWALGRSPIGDGLPAVGRGKVVDNLRRSLVAPTTFALIVLCWLLPLPSAAVGILLVLAALAVPTILQAIFTLVPGAPRIRLRNHIGMLVGDLRMGLAQVVLSLAFLPDQAWQMVDAISRTLWRLYVSRRHLLEWTTAAQSSGSPRLDAIGFYRRMAGGTVVSLTAVLFALAVAPGSWPVVVPFALLWLAAPAVALWSSRSPTASGRLGISTDEARSLRLIARRTWRFFETFVTPADNMLPPDNFQEDPKPVVARRTSPTNVGLYLLSSVAARDYGWTGTLETVERLEACFASLVKLQRFRGHFLNWYATEDLRPLDPAYVSSVDSGNLAGHLIAFANACEEWEKAPIEADVRSGLSDTLDMVRGALASFPIADPRPLGDILDRIEALLKDALPIEASLAVIRHLTQDASRAVPDDTATTGGEWSDVRYWTRALGMRVDEHSRDLSNVASAPGMLERRLLELAAGARTMAMEMDFAFLVDPDRKLLSIGYSVADERLDASCYDLLASEARLASLFAIAKGDAPTRHWFRLGRTATPLGNGSALVSWSGSMFEYLMPSLVMRAPATSLLADTNRLVVERQQAYGRSLNIPWGISESAYNARDMELTYQYSNFGVPGLGLKRGLADNRVVAPYATGLAAMVDPLGALRNFGRLEGLGARGRFGFYDALDFTRSRVPEGAEVAIVRNYMAHHQGMTIVAIANAVGGGPMRDRFHREPMIRASELLLQERMPRDVSDAHPRAEDVRDISSNPASAKSTVRRLKTSPGAAPLTHLLSNGRYTVMLTATGAGYSRWRDIAVSRWHGDPTRDAQGSFVFLRDVATSKVWSPGLQPDGPSDADEVVLFDEDHAKFSRREDTLTTAMEVLVSGEDDGEVRLVSITNAGSERREIELTSYAELVLTTPATDDAHPAFAKMFVETEYLSEFGALVATRRRRSPAEPEIWAAHTAVVQGEVSAPLQYETDRARFLGRGRTVATAMAMSNGTSLTNTVGTVLDPVFSLRHRVGVPPGKVVSIAFWTLIASSRAALLDLIDKHQDRNGVERARTLAWTQAQVQLRHIGVTPEEAADFQRLAAPLIYADRRFRPSSDAILRGAGPQSGLWQHSISGDLPIVLLKIDDIQDIAQVRQLLRAHEYWRMKRLAVDLVIVNERASSYVQDLQVAIETAVRSSQSRPRLGAELAEGSAYVLRADLMSTQSRLHLDAVARVDFVARRGAIAEQLARVQREYPGSPPAFPSKRRPARGTLRPNLPDLEFFNGFGGFDKEGREYVTVLEPGVATPAPWINVVSNPSFGFQASAEGAGYTWAGNSRENQLTPWSNDPVSDPPGEAFYVRDEDTLEILSPTARPVVSHGAHIARHGWGYSRFEHEAGGLHLDLLQFVPLADPVKISRLRIRNTSEAPRRLTVTAYAELVLGTSRTTSGSFLTTEMDEATGAMFARNPWSTAFPGRVAFADLLGRQTSWSGDRTEFLGRGGSLGVPAALERHEPLSGRTGAGLDPCAALATHVEVPVGETVEIVSLLGQGGSAEEARGLVERYRAASLDAVFAEVRNHWTDLLGTVTVRTPDRAMDIMLNGWLLYQTLACRIWARSAFYQASGAYGFRDQLQDGMALTFARPETTRHHLLRAAGRQFVEGDVQHWWLPQSGQGVRTRISDDRVWLAFAAATYVRASGDAAVLDEDVSFLTGPQLAPGEHDAFFQPMQADESATLFEHCARGLDQCLELTGDLGLPLIGTGDWNDGMNRVGEAGRGESVWLGWLLLRTIAIFSPLAEGRDPERVDRWRKHAEEVRSAIEREAWDGAWYRRATFDDGTWLGSTASEECRIDSIAQSWAVLSGAARPERAKQAMASLGAELVRPDEGLALLFTPPFDRTPHDPGYIKGYPPGLRENGGQYSHAAMWAVFAHAQLGDGEKAHALFALLNPINHARNRADAERYKVEPYVVAADVYSVPPHAGRGGWTWYTGSAGWMYRAGIEGILGIRREGDTFVIDPCLPPSWPMFEASMATGASRCDVRVHNRHGADGRRVEVDGRPQEASGTDVRVPIDAVARRVEIWL
jgi:cyclic beta-1,2-glucan synthetase